MCSYLVRLFRRDARGTDMFVVGVDVDVDIYVDVDVDVYQMYSSEE